MKVRKADMKKLLRKKEKGMANVIICLMFFIIVVICLMFSLKYKNVKMARDKMDDGITASSLAALIIDMDTYTATSEYTIHPEKAYNAFVETLKINLNLNDNMEALNPVYYTQIDIEDFIIYNVYKNDVTVIKYNGGIPDSYTYSNGLGTVTAVNGEKITSSSIYVKLSLSLNSFMSSGEKYVDIDNLLAVEMK